MRNQCFVALAGCALAGAALAADNPFESFKGKIKEGMYEYKMEMDMGAIPACPPEWASRT